MCKGHKYEYVKNEKKKNQAKMSNKIKNILRFKKSSLKMHR